MEKVIKGKLVANEKICKQIFIGGELIAENEKYRAYPAKDKNIQKILYQYNEIPEVEYLCEEYGIDSVIIMGVNDEIFKLCLEEVQKAEYEMRKCENEAEKEFKEIFKRDGNFKSVFNGMVSCHIVKYIDLENRTFSAFSEGRDSYKSYTNQIRKNNASAESFFNGKSLEKYLWNFLKRNFYWQYKARVTPKIDIGAVHMGQNGNGMTIDNVKSLYVSPRLRPQYVGGEEKWENYKALNRRVAFKPFSIGHLMKTGFIINNHRIAPKDRLIYINTLEEFYTFFDNELTSDEKLFVKQYLKYTEEQKHNKEVYESIPLLLPQYRYGGLEIQHKYRADFLIIDAYDSMKSAFIEIDDPHHREIYDIDTEKRNEFEARYHFQHFTIRPQDNIEEFFEKRIKSLLC